MNPKSIFPNRLKDIRAQFDSLKVDAFLVTFEPHLHYLSGFTGSNGIGLITKNVNYLLTDGRYAIQVRNEAQGWKIFITHDDLVDELKKRKLLRIGSRVAFDANALLYNQFKKLGENFPGVKFIPTKYCVERIAAVKDQNEIEKIRKAVEITDRVFIEILAFIKPGVSELDIAAEISYRHRKHGSEKDAFETIVASGVRSALPHGHASRKKMQRGDIVTLDFGCIFGGYPSDMTRTIFLGRPKPEAKKIYNIVLEAQLRAIDAARIGAKAKDVDAIARNIINKKGYGRYFRHSLGHGIGLQIHEQPRLSRVSEAVLEEGNVITIEPGIYIPNLGGVRIEDDIVITNGYCDVLTKSSKELLIL